MGAELVCEPPAGADVMDLQEFYEHIEKHRLESTERLVKKYRNISPLLGKIEEVGAGRGMWGAGAAHAHAHLHTPVQGVGGRKGMCKRVQSLCTGSRGEGRAW